MTLTGTFHLCTEYHLSMERTFKIYFTISHVKSYNYVLGHKSHNLSILQR